MSPNRIVDNLKGVEMAGDLIKKDNVLVNAAYTLSLAEQRLILLSIANAAGNADLLKDTNVHAAQYAERFHVSIQASYMALREAALQLFERKFSYERLTSKGHKRNVISRWVQKIEYGESEGMVKLRFADDVIPLLTDLQQRFTYYGLKHVASLTSVHAVRLYELLIAWRKTGKTPVFELSEFRLKLGIEEKEYQRMTDFKKRVLDFAIKQINEHSDIIVEYEQHKKGRSISGFSFRFKLKDEAKAASNIALDAKNKKGKTEISIEQANNMANRGESYQAAYARLQKNGYFIKGLR